MGALSDILKAKLETLLGERGTGKDAAVRRGELDALLAKAVNLSMSKTGGGAGAQVTEALRIAKRAEAAVEAVRAAQADLAAETADDTAQNARLSEAISILFQWNGGTYTLRVPATGITGRVLEDQIADEAITIAKFATGLRPVELLDSLPTTGNFDGRHVYRTSDKSLWRHNGTAWVNTNSTSLLVGKIVAGQIEVGAVGAQELAALAVSAKHLAIANWVNLFDGADAFATSPFTPLPTTNGGLGFWDGTTTYQGQKSLGLDAAWGTGAQYQMREIPVTPGTEYYIEFWANRNAAWNGGAANSKLRFGNQTGAFIADLPFDAASLTAGTWVKRSRTVAVPAGVTKLNITLTSDATAGWVRLAGLTMRQRNGGELIVDGSIKASHIEVDAIGANQLAANAVAAKHMVITDFTNLAGSSDMLDETHWTLGGGAIDYINGNTFWQSEKLLSLTATAGSYGIANGRKISVSPGDKFLAVCNARIVSGAGSCFMQVQTSESSDFSSSTFVTVAATTATSITELSGEITIPAGHLFMRLRLILGNDGATGCYFGNVNLRRKTAGKLIVDGTVKANHTDTASFSASGLAIFGGELKSSNFVQGSSGWRIKQTGEAEMESLLVRTRHIEDGAVSADWNSYTAGWITYSGNSGGSVQSVTINDSTVNGCIAWITFSAQIGLYSNLGGLASGAISLRLGSDVIGQWDVMQNVAPSVEIQLPISITRRIALPATGPHFIAADASAYGSAELGSLSHFRLRYRRLEINVMKR